MKRRAGESSAERHDRVRRQHAGELAQDYVEAIHLRDKAGESIRVTDLQKDFGVSHVSVIRALQRLEKRGLLVYNKESGIQLSRDGEKMAKASAERHELLSSLLIRLGVSTLQADADAEGAEHHLSEESFKAIKRFLGK